jgi:transcriptional regulator with XRE-family HTH domain
MSQLSLAAAAATPARHVSFLETGRSRPGTDLVLRLARALDVPLRAQNELLSAAGLAASYSQHRLSDAVLAPYRRAIGYTLGALDPYPAIVVDRSLAIVDANRAARRVFDLSTSASLLDLLLSPGGLRQHLLNFDHVAWAWHDRLVRESSGDPQAEALIARMLEQLRHVPRPSESNDGLVVCPTFRVGARVIRTVGMSVRFAPGRDVTLEELAIEVLYPRDDDADDFFRGV